MSTTRPASVTLAANHACTHSSKATTTSAQLTDTLARLPQSLVSRSSACAPLGHAPGPQVVLPTSNVFAKNLFGSWQSSWALLALIGFVSALSMQTQEAASAVVSIVALSAVSALLQQLSSPSTAGSSSSFAVSQRSPSSSAPQRSSAWDKPQANNFVGTATNSNGPLAQLLVGLRSAASRRISRCLRRWTAICGC